jgi:GNAT superfamily N-acetyltransferase
MIEVCEAQIRDMPHVVRLDTQTQEFALDVDEAKKWFTEDGRTPYIARLSGREVGFAMAQVNKSGTCIIARIGVHLKFRRVGIGRKIVERITLEAATENIGTVNMIVPSYIIDDMEDPWNIEQWLWKLGFKATGVITDHFRRYNRNYDGYAFQRMKDDSQAIC